MIMAVKVGLLSIRDSPVFPAYHQEVVSGASSFQQSLPRHEKICNKVISPSHIATAERQLLLAKPFNWYTVSPVSEWALLLLDLRLQ